MAIEAFTNRIIVEYNGDNSKNKTKSGLVIPENNSASSYLKGKVVSIGKRVYRDGQSGEFGLKVGDTILYSQFGGTKVENEKYVILQEEDILAVEV